MKYLSIDIETTGLDASWCQILEIGVVLADTVDMHTPVEDLKHWSCRLYYDRVVGEPYALKLNADLIGDMEKRPTHHNYLHPDSVWSHFTAWLEKHGFRDEKLSFSGKNYGTFDSTFLVRLPRWNRERFRQRVIDPGNFFMMPDDDKMPDLKTCLERARLEYDPKRHHKALEDARMVVELNRVGLRQLWRNETLPTFGGWSNANSSGNSSSSGV